MTLDQNVLIAAAVACGALLLLAGTLGGVWLGFRVVRGDSALLTAVGAKADAAAGLARLARDDVKQLGDLIEDHAERMERKRASIAGTLSQLERVREEKTSDESNGEHPPQLIGDPLAGLQGAARRLAGQRIFGRG